MYPSYKAPPIPRAFIWRRIHSLTGLWLVLFLIEHLFTNSQAALLIGDNGNGFVTAVNSLRALPYLPLIEIFLLGVPFLIHGIWGIKYLLTSELNSFPTDGAYPALPQYRRNRAFTWQRITSWLLLVGIIAHVIHMRIIEYPASAQLGTDHVYLIRVDQDEGLYTLSKRLGFDLYDRQQIQRIKDETLSHPLQQEARSDAPSDLIQAQDNREHMGWVNALEKFSLEDHQLIAASTSFGVVELLMVRDSFKNPLTILLYTAFVLAACFHAFNGLWTFMIRWGITLTATSQYYMRKVAIFLMVLISFLGLAAIWGTYWLNLRS